MATNLSKLRSMGRSEMKLDRVWRVWNNEEWDNAINEAILEIQNQWDFKWDENQKTATFDSVEDQQEYDIKTLIPDFIGLDLVKYSDNPINSVDYINLKASYSQFPEWTPTSYYLYGGKIGLNPIPTVIDTVDITYRWILTDLEDDLDESPFGTNFDRAIVLYACYVLLNKPGDSKNFQRGEIKLKRFNEVIARLYKTYLIQDKGQLWFKNTYTPRSKIYASRRRRFVQ